jgi:hypothetical protein
LDRTLTTELDGKTGRSEHAFPTIAPVYELLFPGTLLLPLDTALTERYCSVENVPAAATTLPVPQPQQGRNGTDAEPHVDPYG